MPYIELALAFIKVGHYLEAYVVKLPDMLIAPVVLRDGNPSIVMRALLLAIVTPPPTVFNNGMEMFVKAELAIKARSPPTLVRFGAITLSK